MPTPTLYSIRSGAKANQLIVKEVWKQDGKSPLATGYKQMITLAAGGQNYLIGFDATGKGSAFKLSAKKPFIEPAASNINVGAADIIEPFVLGMELYILAYQQQKGIFSYYSVSNDLSTSALPYQFSHPRVPLTAGFTVTQPVIINSLLYILSYNFTTGDVDIWSLQVTPYPPAGTQPGTPPLLMLPVWVHQWAKSWNRFAFFMMGGETFFFKINFGPKLNVNIDHVSDDPTQGTVEVGTWLQNLLDDPTKIDIVEPFTMNGGDPYYVTYRASSGSTDWFRIHADCQGWTKEHSGTTVKSASQVVPYQLGDDRFALFY